jgi:hypothetical protein
VEQDVVMLTYDAFTLKFENPKLYMLFYEYYFLRAAVGQETFERNIKYPEDEECFGTPTNHGFAH